MIGIGKDFLTENNESKWERYEKAREKYDREEDSIISALKGCDNTNFGVSNPFPNPVQPLYGEELVNSRVMMVYKSLSACLEPLDKLLENPLWKGLVVEK